MSELIKSVFYLDLDEDGFGDPNNTALSCQLPDNAVENSEDCDDDPSSGGDINPLMAERNGSMTTAMAHKKIFQLGVDELCPEAPVKTSSMMAPPAMDSIS